MATTYILQSLKTGRYYIGSTDNLENRIERHNHGYNRSTKNGRPWQLVYREDYATKYEAYKREMKIKSYKGGRAFKELLS